MIRCLLGQDGKAHSWFGLERAVPDVAQHVNVVLVDDIDGSSASETVTFSLDGVSYEIDLNEDNAARLRSSVSEFVEKGRRAG
ncbi:histone-like nucleoid-structuring protein Lsr2, partial [Aquipuribacter hungaricus]|uniref:histone-like nucleoid-structuring protein Lsr2 n=1 Tax=Aquipuribacter hungaricus TaxID=545624 RepID=UPI003BEEEF9B